jgi:hypothetical protein
VAQRSEKKNEGLNVGYLSQSHGCSTRHVNPRQCLSARQLMVAFFSLDVSCFLTLAKCGAAGGRHDLLPSVAGISEQMCARGWAGRTRARLVLWAS